MGAICHITPVLNDILDLCRFDFTYLTPPHQNFTGCILSHYTTAIQPISIQPLQTQQKPRVTEAQHNAEKHFLFLFQIISQGTSNGKEPKASVSVGCWLRVRTSGRLPDER